jgi:outer membrane lipoprotein LolB
VNGVRNVLRLGRYLPWVALFLIASCASGTRQAGTFDQNFQTWQGRLAVKVKGEAAQSFSAQYALQGTAASGKLSLYTPLGITVAHVQWSPESVVLFGQGEPRQFATLDALTLALTGTELPIASLFAWLDGSQKVDPQWRIERADLENGVWIAHRDFGASSVDVKVLLER